jgi:hypothetical protein
VYIYIDRVPSPDYIDVKICTALNRTTLTEYQRQAIRLHQATSKIFVELYIVNKNHRQGLYPRDLPPPPIKPAAADPMPPPPQNRCRLRTAAAAS